METSKNRNEEVSFLIDEWIKEISIKVEKIDKKVDKVEKEMDKKIKNSLELLCQNYPNIINNPFYYYRGPTLIEYLNLETEIINRNTEALLKSMRENQMEETKKIVDNPFKLLKIEIRDQLFGSPELFGQIENTSEDFFTMICFDFNFYNKNGEIVDTDIIIINNFGPKSKRAFKQPVDERVNKRTVDIEKTVVFVSSYL